jgi:tRNA (mo5U34)-methyltransferase
MDGQRSAIDPRLSEELAAKPTWMYPWELANGVIAPSPGVELADVHQTRLAMIEPVCRRWLAETPGATVVDLGCCEGWFGHRLLEWGAERVVGVDVRAVNVRRAELVRDHFGIPRERLEFVHAGVHEVPDIGEFDIVLVLGLIYHLEDPVGALRVARRLARRHVLVESQLTELNGPIAHGWGVADEYMETDTHWVSYLEPSSWQEDEGNVTASFAGVLSLIPNRAALLQALSVSGFGELEVLPAPPGLNTQFVGGHRAVVAGDVVPGPGS